MLARLAASIGSVGGSRSSSARTSSAVGALLQGARHRGVVVPQLRDGREVGYPRLHRV